MFEKRILTIYSIIVGILFLISGIGKSLDTAAFSELIYQYGFRYFMILAPAIVLAEILIGLFLVLLINPRRYSMLSFVLLSVFTAAFAYAYFRRGVTDCGCFGSLQHAALSPMLTFGRNAILLIMAFVVWRKYPEEKTDTPAWKKILVSAGMVVAIFLSGYSYRLPYYFQKNESIHLYQDKDIRETALSKYLKTSRDSSYMVFCFSYSCPHCWNSIENFRQFRSSGVVDSVMALTTGNDSDRLVFIRDFNPDFSFRHVSADSLTGMINVFPTAFIIEKDTVKYVIQGTLPSPVTYTKQYRKPQ